MDDLMDKINLWGSDDDDYESEVSEDATTEATVLTTKAPSHTTEQDSSGDDAGLAFNVFFMLLFVIIHPFARPSSLFWVFFLQVPFSWSGSCKKSNMY